MSDSSPCQESDAEDFSFYKGGDEILAPKEGESFDWKRADNREDSTYIMF
jgi:hypothetical protein